MRAYKNGIMCYSYQLKYYFEEIHNIFNLSGYLLA
jgi:hypothetical protein